MDKHWLPGKSGRRHSFLYVNDAAKKKMNIVYWTFFYNKNLAQTD